MWLSMAASDTFSALRRTQRNGSNPAKASTALQASILPQTEMSGQKTNWIDAFPMHAAASKSQRRQAGAYVRDPSSNCVQISVKSSSE